MVLESRNDDRLVTAARHPTNSGGVITECSYCHHTLVESYGAEVELLQNGKVLRTASLFGLHFWCARDWVMAETERLREQYAYDSNFSAISRVEVEV